MTEKAKVRDLPGIQEAFREIHLAASDLLVETAGLQRFWLLFSRQKLRSIEDRLEAQLESFSEIDGEFLTRAASVPSTHNALEMHEAKILAHASVRDSVRGMLLQVDHATGSVRNELDSRWSVLLSVIALIVAAMSLWAEVAASSGAPQP
jgi:hypothetical protein